jgi:hypothetical protein
MTNFYQFKGVTKSKKNSLKKIVFGPYIYNFYNKISEISIILKDLNKIPTTQLVYNQMWQSSYG